MIVKSPEFDVQFNKDISEIAINRKGFRQKGSYKIKEFGEFVTDIDLEAIVYYDRKLLDIISNILDRVSRSRNFTFITFAFGRRREFKFPWYIDGTGSCDFNLEKTRDWIKNFDKKLIPKEVYSRIENILYGEKLKIWNLVEIENDLLPYSEITWTREDIRNGFKIMGGIKYDMLEEMKTETPVLEFVYHPNENEICAIDMGLVDFRYKSDVQSFHNFYNEDWYKILKTYRWKLEEKYKKEYLGVMSKVGKAIAIKYQVELINRLKGVKISPVIMKNLYTDTQERLYRLGMRYSSAVSDEIYVKINAYLEKYVEYFYKKLEPKFQKAYLIYLQRGKDAQIPSSQSDISKREAQGVKCPFFAIDIFEFDKLIDLSVRLEMEPEKVVGCFSSVAEQLGISVKTLMKEVKINNDLYLVSRGEEIIIKNQIRELGKFPKKYKKRLQTIILF